MSDHDTMTDIRMTDKPKFELKFEALPNRVPVEVRLKALLKRALRDWGLKCVRCRPVDEPEEEHNAND